MNVLVLLLLSMLWVASSDGGAPHVAWDRLAPPPSVPAFLRRPVRIPTLVAVNTTGLTAVEVQQHMVFRHWDAMRHDEGCGPASLTVTFHGPFVTVAEEGAQPQPATMVRSSSLRTAVGSVLKYWKDQRQDRSVVIIIADDATTFQELVTVSDVAMGLGLQQIAVRPAAWSCGTTCGTSDDV